MHLQLTEVSTGTKIHRIACYASLIGILVLCGYELLVGLPRHYDGKWVQRHTTWHARRMGLPIPYQRGTMYYFYTDEQGCEIRHGKFRDFYGNGAPRSYAYYRHGEFFGTSTNWNHKGEKAGEAFYLDGQQVGWSVYLNGELHYHNEQIHVDRSPVATKRFEEGKWFLQFPSGTEPRFTIDSSSGVLSPLDGF